MAAPDWTALRDDGLALDCIRDAELLDHGQDMLAAGALAVTDGLRRHHRGLEFVRRVDIRFAAPAFTATPTFEIISKVLPLPTTSPLAASCRQPKVPVMTRSAAPCLRSAVIAVHPLKLIFTFVPGGALEHRHQRFP